MLARIVDFIKDLYCKTVWGILGGLSVLCPLFIQWAKEWGKAEFTLRPHSARLLSVVMAAFVIIFCYRRSRTIWESKKLRELRGYGPDPSNYAIAALIAGFVLLTLDLAGLLEHLLEVRKVATQILGFTLYILHSLTFGLIALGFGLLWAVELRERDFPDGVRSYPDYLQPGGLAEKVIRTLKREFAVPEEKELRITNQQWYNNKFRMEVQFVKTGVEKVYIREETSEPRREIKEIVELAKRCEVETDHRGQILSLTVQEEEWKPL